MKKKKLLLFAALIALTLSGCKKEEITNQGEGVPRTFTAYFASPDNKVHLEEVANNGLRPGWDSGDQINVNGSSCNVTNINSSNSSRATFTGDITNNADGPYYSVYPDYGTTFGKPNAGGQITYPQPEEEPQSKDGEEEEEVVPTITVTLPRVQYYRDPNGVQMVDAPMLAYNPENPVLKFNNLCGIMQVVVTNDKAWDMVLDSIHVVSSDYDLWGSGFTVNTPNSAPSISAPEASGKNTISLARANSGSIGTTVLSTRIHGTNTPACTLYVYLPPISSTSNKFTVRVFSHPKWGNTPDDEVHIVYTKTQTSNSSGAISASEILRTPISLESCGKFGTTFTSLKAFSTVRNNQTYQICFSRGNLQYYATRNNNASTSSLNAIRFAPRQWSFINNQNMNDAAYTNKWIDHFCWASGNNFEYHTGSSANHDNGDNHLYGSNLTPTNADWAKHLNDNSLWHTPTRSELYNLLPWDDPLTDVGGGVNGNREKEDTSSRFAWVSLTGFTDINGTSYGTQPLYGIMLIPDVYRNDGEPFSSISEEDGAQSLSLGTFNLNNNGNGKLYNDNSLNVEQFEYYEAKGCIFLPCLGTYLLQGTYNDGWNQSLGLTSLAYTQGPEGTYWTSTFKSGVIAFVLKLKVGNNTIGTYVYPNSDGDCGFKSCVRLVSSYPTQYIFDPDQM